MDFRELINVICLLKLLHETDRRLFAELVDIEALKFDTDGYYYDDFYELFYDISNGLFEYAHGDYYDRRGISITVYSGLFIEEYFRLAGEYGKANGIAEADNPYFKQAEEEMCENFRFSYSLDWVLKGYAEPKRKYQSRFALLMDEYEYVDFCGVAIGLLRMYRFFRENVQEMKELLHGKEACAA